MAAGGPSHQRTAEDLRASILYSVARVCKDESAVAGVEMTKEATAALGELVYGYLTGGCYTRVSAVPLL